MINIRILSTTLIAITFVLVVSLVVVFTRAADSVLVTATAEITNEPPTVDSINFSNVAFGSGTYNITGFTPSVGVDTPLHITGMISDANGVSDIASTSIMFYRSGVTDTCTDDKNDCYSVATCDIATTTLSDTETTYNCPLDIAFWADATDSTGRFPDEDWIALVTVTDQVLDAGVMQASTTINSLLALNIPDEIDYGLFSVGATTTADTNKETPLAQRGNTRADVELYGNDMTCDVLGTIPVGNQKYALTDIGYDDGGVALSASQTKANRIISYREDDAVDLAASLFWNIKIPAIGVKGLCTGANTITIVAAGDENQATLFDGKLANVRYTSSSKNGRTTGSGTFDYVPGETVTFSIGNVTIGSIAVDDIPADKKVFLHDLYAISDYTNTADTKLVNAARFLQSLDTDNDPDNGITISETAHTNLTSAIDFATAGTTTLQTELSKVGKTLRGEFESRKHMAQTLQAEGKAAFAVPTLSLSSANLTINNTESTELTWSSSNAEICTGLDGLSGQFPLSKNNQSTGSLSTTTTFTITCEGMGGVVTKSQKVTVSPTRSIVFGQGYSHVHARKSDGTLWAWGANSFGQLGLNDTATRTVPVRVGTATDWDVIRGGRHYAVAIKSNGTLWAWGANSFGQLGLNDTATRTVPVQVGTATDWAQIAAGSTHTVAIKSNGTLWAWGANSFGQLGLNDTATRTVPVQVGTATDWAQIAAGESHVVALKTDGTLWAWGYNGAGQLGLNDTSIRTVPVQAGTATDWKYVGVGGHFTFAIKHNGSLWGWGLNNNYQLGLGGGNNTNQLVPIRIGTDEDWFAVTGAVGGAYMLAVKNTGTLWTWGNNENGRTGLGTSTGTQYEPIQIGTDTNWTEYFAAGGSGHSVALRSDNSLWVWGRNIDGQLGLGDTTDRLILAKQTNITAYNRESRQLAAVGSGVPEHAENKGNFLAGVFSFFRRLLHI